MRPVILAFTLLLLASAPARAGGFCEALPRLEALAAARCGNFGQFADPEVKAARAGCLDFHDSIKQSATALCALDRALDRLEADNEARPELAEARTMRFLRQWQVKLAGGPRRSLEIAYASYKNVLEDLNEFGLGLLRQEATSCGRQGSAPSPAYIGLALAAGFEGAHTHAWATKVFDGLALALSRQAQKNLELRRRLTDVPEAAPGTPPEPMAGEAPEQAHPAEPGIKGLITEAISQILKLEGLQGLGIDLVEKLFITQKMDVLDLVVLATKAIVITAGGASAGPTVGISLGIALAINGAIDYLEYGIRSVHVSFEQLAHARMEEVLLFHKCQLRRNRALLSDQLARSYHDWRRDGLCGAPCAERGLFGLCRPSVVFTAERCE